MAAADAVAEQMADIVNKLIADAEAKLSRWSRHASSGSARDDNFVQVGKGPSTESQSQRLCRAT